MARAIEVRGLHKGFGTVKALCGLDLDVEAGRIFGFLGPNGAGKTTTLHILLGLVPADRGEAHVAGLPVRTHAHQVRRRCGVLLEHNGLYENLSALENLQFAGRVQGMARTQATQKAREALAQMGLGDREGDRVSTWSKGMKQKLAVARALLHDPEVLFLDEPTNGFDHHAANQLHAALRALVQKRGLTVFLTTHNLREAEALCDEVAVLRGGTVVAQGPPTALASGAPVLQVRIDGDPRHAVTAAARLPSVEAASVQGHVLSLQLTSSRYVPDAIEGLVAAGVRILDARSAAPGLEEAFVRLLEAA